jgi:stage II sporulation protein D
VFALAACLVLATPVPVLTPTPVPSLHADFPFAPSIPKPAIRVGFDLPEGPIALSVSRGTFTIHEPGDPEPVWTDRAAGGVMLVIDGAASGAPLVVKRVQIGTFRSEARATELAERLAGEWQVPSGASWDSSRNVWRVRLGEAETTEGLFELLRQARDGGFPDAWIVSEPRRSQQDAKLKLLDSRWNSYTARVGRLLFVPQAGTRLTVAGKSYRGLIEARISPFGEVQMINELGLEHYLRGVVPLELGPAIFPELDALKAQAIAARTYAMANLGQFVDEGFDTCDSARCQVYGGSSAEHPLSDRAVQETEGELLIHESKPINALFTATCGGHTENVEVVFPEWRGAYLRGVPCYAETKDLSQAFIELRGSALPHSISEEPSAGRIPLLRAAAIAASIVPSEAEESTWRAGPLGEGEFRNWLTRLARAAGRPVPADGPSSARRLELWRAIARWLGLIDQAQIELLPGDEQVLVMSADRGDVAEQDWGWLAALIEQGIPLLDETGRLRGQEIATRGEALFWLLRLVELFDAAPLWDATVQRGVGRSLVLRNGKLERAFALGSEPLLLAESAAGWYRLASVMLLPGDKVMVLAEGANLRALAVRRRFGVGDDRRGTKYRWTEIRDAAQLSESLGKVAPVGKIRNIAITRRGVSDRVAELTIEGSEGRAVIEGFRVRRALDLPEILFTVKLQHDDDGLVQRAIFQGRGWGHGVGLCQSGAFGMALRGKSYREILAHYYPGARLESQP